MTNQLDAYRQFIASKSQSGGNDGFDPIFMPDCMFDFQQALTTWSIQKGRSAIFADCGMGKTLLQLVWAENVVRKTGRSVLIITPLAVARQTAREAEKFDIETKFSRLGVPPLSPTITITNYERLHLFDANDYAGAVCDESSILKSFDGVRRQQITEFMRKLRYRLLCTATPSPNEYIELGTSSEALGYLGYMDMLSRFFKNNQGNSIKPFTRHQRHSEPSKELMETAKWRFKGHAEIPFWQWVCSWSRSIRRPSDIGFDDGQFILPALLEKQHQVISAKKPEGMLFKLPAIGLKEQREERRHTIDERCEKAASLVAKTGNPAIVWCHLNDEGNQLEKLIPDCVQVSGNDSDDAKEEKFLSFIDGGARVLVTKGKIGAWGLNFQHCNHSVSFPTHSFEEYYQSVRRCWRFGQTKPVQSDIIATDGELNILKNLQRKARAADRMFSNLVRLMNQAVDVKRSVSFSKQEEIPQWL